ncbi:MAG TPA: HEPN domain-containing protein [Niabella sp.]|nr:HEPN domain-containing protein [Niabella sp.]
MNEELTVPNDKVLYLDEKDKAITAKVVAAINKIVQADTIFVMGRKENVTYNIFTDQRVACRQISAWWLLILITGDNKYHKVFQDEIEKKCSDTVPVSCIVMQTTTFQHWLNENSTFAFTVLLKAPVIHNLNPELEALRDKHLIETSIPEVDKKVFKKCADLFKEYIAGAELYTVRKHYKLALFMCHQATELLVTAFLKSQTGLELHIHNINNLNNYLSFLVPGIAEDFCGKSELEQESFRLLQKSYCAARYDTGFSVKYKQLEITRQRLTQLVEALMAQ